jgi:hypothetical protein
MISPDGSDWTIVCRDHADLVGFVLDDDRREAVALVDHFGHLLEQQALGLVEVQRHDAFVREHHELREVHGVSSFTQNLALWTLLSAGLQERAYVLEVVRGCIRGERLRRRQRLPVAREYVTDLALRDGDERHTVHAILEREEEVETTAQRIGLKPGFATKRDQALLHRAACAPQLLDHADAGVRNVANHPGPQENNDDQQDADAGEYERYDR